MDAVIPAILCLGLLYQWSHHRAREHAARVAERQERCPHRPEAQRTLRVNNILTLNPALLHRVLPGRRWLTKECLDCGLQTHRYTPTLQPWDEYVAEWRQETIDREAQYRARERAHVVEVADAERERLRKRAAK